MSRYIQAGGPRHRFQSACGDAPSDAFLAGAIQSAARSGRFSVEAGTRVAAPFPAPLSPLAASFLRCAPDRFHLTKPNTFQHNREASVATLRWCSGSSRNAVRLPSEQAFSFAGIPKRARKRPWSMRSVRLSRRFPDARAGKTIRRPSCEFPMIGAGCWQSPIRSNARRDFMIPESVRD
jgi:hypothetical protein